MLNFIYSFLIFLCLTFSSGYSQIIQPELEVTEENYENLVLGAAGKRWSDVDTMLSKLLIGSGNGRQNKAIKAIHLLNNYNKTQTNQSAESTPPEIIQARLLLNEERENINKHKAVFPQQQLDKYLTNSAILKLFVGTKKEETISVLREALSHWIHQNNNKWPGKNQLNIAEQFFWNLRGYTSNTFVNETELIKFIFNTKIDGNWESFLDFSTPYLGGADGLVIINLLSIYRAFPGEAGRAAFINFCEPYLVGQYMINRLTCMKTLIYDYKMLQEFEEINEAAFINFSEPYLGNMNLQNKLNAMRVLISVYRTFPEKIEREEFIKLCELYSKGVDVVNKLRSMGQFLHIYRAFPDKMEREAFISFCEQHLRGVEAWRKLELMIELLPLYKTFPEKIEREAFISFCEQQLDLVGVNVWRKPALMIKLFPIYKIKEREKFLEFCEPYLVKEKVEDRLEIMGNILLIYRAFDTDTEREAFINFCERHLGVVNVWRKPAFMTAELLLLYKAEFISFCEQHLVGVDALDKLGGMSNLLPVYKAFTDAERAEFISFCDPYLMGLDVMQKTLRMMKLLPIYLSGQRTDFEEFIKTHKKGQEGNQAEQLISSYLRRSYLRYMRADGALKAELHPENHSRIQPMYETNLASPLPIIFAQDPFLPQARVAIGARFANAHDFDDVYELDRPILWSETLGYNASTSHTPRTIYNNHEIKTNYHTNEAVENFIGYLDTTIAAGPDVQINAVRLNGTQVVSIIKQMLGLEPKSGSTRGGFAPYLSSSMYYAKPDAPLGDEMLGRTWSYINSLPGEDYKKSVVLALLEAAEVSQTSIDTHCQTRITGELMKLVAFILPRLHLRPLIAGIDLPPVQSDRDIEARITAAPLRAQQLFKKIKEDDGGTIKRLIDSFYVMTGTELPLWKRYEAYYDIIYGRTKNEDGNGYRSDENILTRDERGNLVSKYNADGSMKAVPNIVYYQSEFQVFEKTFTKLMQKEFEEQRGLKY